jgi:hypothetical protein
MIEDNALNSTKIKNYLFFSSMSTNCCNKSTRGLDDATAPAYVASLTVIFSGSD